MNRLPNAHMTKIDTLAFHEFERQGWETAAQAYSRHLSRLTSMAIPSLLEAVHTGRSVRLIDLATGPGYVAEAAQKAGCDVVGVDFSENMIALATSMHSGIEFEVADVQKLPQANRSFDSAVMNFGILHLSEPERGLAEIFRILKPGGEMAFTVWAGPEEAEGFNLIRRALETFGNETLGNEEISIPAGPSFFGFSDSEHTRQVLTDLGFVNIVSRRLSLVWIVDSAQDVFAAIYEGAARTGELLRRQSPDALTAIRKAVVESCAPYMLNGKARIPMPAVVYSASKPAISDARS
jgi:ubiquinone/menaquinone biosynthesis C-methylase UbiE